MKYFRFFLFVVVLYSCKPNTEHAFLDFPLIHFNSYGESFENDSSWVYASSIGLNNFYWGIKPTNVLDLNANFKSYYDSNNMYFNIKVIDQTRYTHFIPADSLERSLWNPDDYDQIKLLFEVTSSNTFSVNKYEIRYNYGLDTIFGNPSIVKLITILKEEDSVSYGIKLKLPYKALGVSFNTKNQISGFNIIISDNDKLFCKENIDVLNRWETLVGR